MNSVDGFEQIKKAIDNIEELEHLQHRQMASTIKIMDSLIDMLETQNRVDESLIKALGANDDE